MVEEASDVLNGLSPEVLHGFTRLVSGSAACDCLGVASPLKLARAYLALGLDYLEEVANAYPTTRRHLVNWPRNPGYR